MSRTYGSRYAATADLDLPAVAKLIRADLKTAAADPASVLHGLTCSVRLRHGFINIDIDGLPDHDVHQVDGRAAARATAVRFAVDAITDAYDWRSPDPRDVRLRTNVVVLDDDERTYRASMAALRT